MHTLNGDTLASKITDKKGRLMKLIAGLAGVQLDALVDREAARKHKRALVVAGKPGGGERVDGAVTTWYAPDSAALAGALKGAGRVVCRSGYSTLLDLAQINVRAHLIPTPGQPEQELLAVHFARAFGWSTSSQRSFAGGAPFPVTGQPLHLPANAAAQQALRNWLS